MYYVIIGRFPGRQGSGERARLAGRRLFRPCGVVPIVNTRPDPVALSLGAVAIAVLFIPIPIVTQLVGVPLLVYACYRYWGRD